MSTTVRLNLQYKFQQYVEQVVQATIKIFFRMFPQE